jgi:hypothetical protein
LDRVTTGVLVANIEGKISYRNDAAMSIVCHQRNLLGSKTATQTAEILVGSARYRGKSTRPEGAPVLRYPVPLGTVTI